MAVCICLGLGHQLTHTTVGKGKGAFALVHQAEVEFLGRD